MTGATRRCGVALILVLWTIAVMALLAGGLSMATRQDVALTGIEQDRITAHWLARAGIERAIAELMDDKVTPNYSDSLADWWVDYPAAMQEAELTGGTFSVMHGEEELDAFVWYGASDESAKLNINVATREQLMKLERMTAPIVGAILDWRDTNVTPEPDGVESGYYSTTRHPYTIRNGPFRTVRELLLVKNVTPELLYREDFNGNGLLDPNEDDGDASAPPDNANGRLDRGWFAYLTAYAYEKNVDAFGQKRLNLNEVGAGELTQRTGLESWAAESIVQHRQRQRFEHLVDLLNVRRTGNASDDASGGTYDALRGDDEKDRPVTQRIFAQIVDSLSLSNDERQLGRVNINTAPQAVLETLEGVSAQLADAILKQRQGLGAYQSIGELLDVSGMNHERFAQIESHITVRSSVFRIFSQGAATSGLANATIECVVDRDGEVPRILYWRESSP